MSTRPTTSEQLRGIGQTLTDVVAPLLKPGYGAEMLRWSVEALERLAEEAPRVYPFLLWERGASVKLIGRCLPHLEDLAEARLASRARDLARGRSDGDSTVELEALLVDLQNLRSLIADIIKAAAFTPGRSELTNLLEEHVAMIGTHQP